MSTRKLSPNWRTRLPKLPTELKQLENELSAKSGHNCFLPRCTSQGCAHPTFSDRTFHDPCNSSGGTMKTKFSLKFSLMMIAVALLALTAFSYGQVGTDVKDAAKDTGKATKKAAVKTGEATEKAADKTGDATATAAKKTGHATKKAAVQTGEATEKAADKNGGATDSAAQQTGYGERTDREAVGHGVKRGAYGNQW